MEAHMGMWGFIPSHSPTLSGAWYDSQISFLAYTFASLCFGREPKARVATSKMRPKLKLKFLLGCWTTFSFEK